jgi:hypothetical protein
MMRDGYKFYGREILGGKWYDTGTPIEYMKTVFDFATTHPDIGADFRAYVASHHKRTAPHLIRRTFVAPAVASRPSSQHALSQPAHARRVSNTF